MAPNIPQGQRYDWWSFPKNDKHKVLVDYVKALESDQAPRRLQWIQFARMYQNQNPQMYYSSLTNASSAFSQMSQWSSRNVVKSTIDTATSKIGKSKPRPLFLTEDGKWDQQQKAKGLTQFMDGQFDSMEIYTKGAMVFRDACIFGIGGLKFSVDTEEGTVACERVIMDEIFVDDADAVYGNPRQIHHVKYVSKTLLKKKYPKFSSEIDAAMVGFQMTALKSYNQDLIRVYESYVLPTSPQAKDGKKVLAIETATLQEDEWNKSYFPFVFFRWCPRVNGFWGLGIAEELYGTQIEINKLLRNIQLAQNLVAVPRIFAKPGSLVGAKLDNNIGSIVYATEAPQFATPVAMTGEIYNHLKWLVQSAYDQIGISEMSATGQKPAGLDSGEAIRQYDDVTSERFMVVGQALEKFYLDAAKITVDLNKDLMDLKKSPKVKIQDKDFLETIDWKSVDLDDDKYILRCFAANLLPTTPAGRLSAIQELIQGGLIPLEEGLRLLDFPDTKAYRNQALASEDLSDKMIASCLKGKYMAPEPQMDLQKALSMAQHKYLEAKMNNASPKGLALLNRWMEAIKGMLPAAPVAVSPMSPMDQAPAGAGGPTEAVPEAPPTSPLLPFNQQ